MILNHTRPDGSKMLIVCVTPTEKRLSKTCFRGKNKKLAGNFLQWESVEKVLNDSWVRAELAKEILSLVKAQDFATHSITIVHGMDVGWDSTDSVELFSDDELEVFEPNRASTAHKVSLPSRLNRKAPLTNEVTFIFELDLLQGKPRAEIKSLYPGTDIGELVGDITERENRVFYDWDHPGA